MKYTAAIYARLSREDEDKIDGLKDSRSIDNQIKVLSSYAIENKIEIYKIYYDDGYSGSNMNRPGITSLLQDAETKKFNTLLIKDISRLGRSLHQVGQLVEQILPQYNIRIISLNDNYDSLNHNEEESIVLRNFLNSYYLKEFKRKCHLSLIHRAKTTHLNYYPKYGYYFDSNGKEQIDEYSSSIVKFIFDLASNGKTTTEISKILNENNILTRSKYAVEVLKLKPLNKKPSEQWNTSKVWEIIKDYEYCGHSVNLLKSDNPIIIKNTHSKIIEEEIFIKANDQIKQRSRPRNKKENISKILFDKTNHKLEYRFEGEYKYRSKYLKTSIKASTIHNILYKNIIELIQECIKNSDIVEQRFENKLFKKNTINIKQLETQIIKINNDYIKLIESLCHNKITQNTFDNKALMLSNKLKQLEEQKKSHDNQQAEYIIFKRKFNSFLESIKTAPINVIELITFAIEKVIIEKNENTKEFTFDVYYKFESF